MASPTAGATEFATLNLDDDLEVGTEAIVKVETESLPKEFHSTTEQNEEPETDAAAVVPAGMILTGHTTSDILTTTFSSQYPLRRPY